MTRSDAVTLQVAQRMLDGPAIFEALDFVEWKSRKSAAPSLILCSIASAIVSAGHAESQAGREVIAIRLLNQLERFAKSALTDVAELDIPQSDDEEENKDESLN